MAELTEGELEFLDFDQIPVASSFKEMCESLSDRELFACLRIIAPIAMKRGLVQWFTEIAPVQ